MKPRLKSAPATDEDSEIWLEIVAEYMEDWATVGVIFRDSDRRDADIMHARSHRHTFFCTTCWEFAAHEACTVDHEIRMRRPFPPDSLGALLRDSLK